MDPSSVLYFAQHSQAVSVTIYRHGRNQPDFHILIFFFVRFVGVSFVGLGFTLNRVMIMILGAHTVKEFII